MRLVARIEIINEDTGAVINTLQARPVYIDHHHFSKDLPDVGDYTEYCFRFNLTIADNIKDE